MCRHLQPDILEFNRWANEKANLVKNSKSADILHHYDARADEISKRIKNRLGPTERFRPQSSLALARQVAFERKRSAGRANWKRFVATPCDTRCAKHGFVVATVL